MPEDGIKLFPHSEILSYEEIIAITKTFSSLGIKKVRITGGEPLIRKNLRYLIEKIAEIKGIEDISLTTNGILLYPMIDDLLKAGLKRVNISLDTLNPQKFKEITKTDGLRDVLKAIDKCMSLNLTPLKINMVAMKGLNDDEILEFVLLTKNSPLHVRYIEYMPWGRRNLWDREKVLDTGEIRQIIESRFGKLSPSNHTMNGPAKDFGIEGFKGIIGFINPVSSHFCSLCNRIRLTADGKLRLCLFSEKEIDIKGYLRKGMSTEDLKSIISNAIYGKPENQDLAAHLKNHHREMSQIGG